jgi:hypothetical protein
VQAATQGIFDKMAKFAAPPAKSQVRIVGYLDDVDEDPNWRFHFRQGLNNRNQAQLTAAEITSQMQFYDKTAEFKYKELDSGSPVTLKEFIRWGVRAYPAKHYMLIVAGHSWGQQGLMQDFFFNGKSHDKSSMIKNYEFRRVMQEIYREEKERIPGGVFDVLLVDGCTSGQLDVLLDWKDVFKYMAAATLETPSSCSSRRE